MKNNKFWVRAAIGISTAAVVISGLIIYRAEKKASIKKTIQNYRVVKLFKVNDASLNSDVSYPGKIQPSRHAELFFRVSGPVIEQKLKLGQTVDAGTILMRLDPRDYEREVERLTHEIEMQKVQCTLAETEFERQRKLLESNAVSRSNYDSAFTKKQAAETQIKILETSLKISQDRLKDTVLYAPFHGTVTSIDIEEHEIAKANVPVITLQDMRDMKIRIDVPAGNLPLGSIYDHKRYNGQKFDVTFPGRGNRQFSATLVEFKPVASASSETYEVLLELKQPENFVVLPGMTAEVHNLPHLQSSQSQMPLVPFGAVFQRNNQSCVWVYQPENRKLELRHVTLGELGNANDLAIKSGITGGELVVSAGGDWLNENDKVKVLNPEILK